ncbi:MAG TPA: SMC family ATPase [Acidimicrobiales bacterium]|nr:SMC family ATPase [Acidimicrobiales bacterium]
MIVRKVYLQNYRVYEGTCELELPEGLVGIYGPNGAGKSYLIESIPWALFGYARGPVDEVRTTGVNDECIVEITFEHEQHNYVVRRALKGGGKTLNHVAVAHSDGLQVATGARDVARYLQQVIGMNEKGFLASVFAEQKQLAALSAQAPGERRKLVLDLLGITPIETAVKAARRDAKEADTLLKSIEGVAADLAALETERDDAAAAALGAEADQVTADAASAMAAESAEAARERYSVISTAIEEGKRAKAQFDKLAADVLKLEADSAALASARAELDQLGDTAELLTSARTAVEVVRTLHEARAAHARAQAAVAKARPAEGGSAEPPDDAAAVEARRAAAAAAEQLAGLNATAKALQATWATAQTNLEQTDELEGDAECPTCGQPLGDAFKDVRAHRLADVASARAAAQEAATVADAVAVQAKDLRASADAADKELVAARKAWQAAAEARDQYAKLVAAEQAAADAETSALHAARVLGLAEAALADQQAALESAAAADKRAQQLFGQLGRVDLVEAELASARGERDDAARDLDQRRADARAKGFTPAGLEEARRAQADATRAAADANQRAKDAAAAFGAAQGRAQELERAYARARDQHARIEPQKVEARLLGRLGELLNAFKDHEAATVGPRLAGHARALFDDMTEGTYSNLDLSDSFEVRITDQNRTFDLKRFSGSEVDLANLALRIAISECVTLQSGGAVGLLVLDEVFGPLDASRRVRLLQALNSLQTRFRQVLVVTHADDVKAQLPSAIEVRPTGDRRATAVVV